MADNSTTDEQIYKNKNNNDLSGDELNNSTTIILKEYQPFIIGDYYFVVGSTNNDCLYIEFKQDDKHYKANISIKNLCIINGSLKSCKNIDEIYNLILESINQKQLNISSIKNNKLKFSLSITIEDTPSPLEIILKEEKDKNAVLLNDNNDEKEEELKEEKETDTEKKKNNNDFILIKDNSEVNSESKTEKNDNIEVASQDINNGIPVNHSHDIKFNLLEDDLNEKNENQNNSNSNSNNNENLEENEVEEEEEKEKDDEPSETNNKENEINEINEIIKIYKIINELKTDIQYLKGRILNKDEESKNDKKIIELEKKKRRFKRRN
jgi:hypothetical protein